MSILFSVEKIPFTIKGKNKIKKWIKHIILNQNKKVGSIQYIFCSDEYVYDMNVTYLKHTTYTDIITFDYTENSQIISGDIYISVDRVRENAKLYDVSFDEELRRVLIHGVLHLLGFPDKTPEQEKRMRLMENEAMALFEIVK